MKKMNKMMLAFALLLAVLAAGAAPALAAGKAGGADLKGTIRVSGAWALYPMMLKWAEEFGKAHRHVRVDVSAGGAGKGAADTLAGLVDIGMVSRDIHPDEVAKGGVAVPVVKDAVIPVINAGNPAAAELRKKGIPQATFKALFMDETSMTWGQIAGQPALTDKVQVYTRSDACGAAETWAKYLGGKQEDIKGVAVYGDPGLADTVRKDRCGLGYNNLNFAYDMRTGRPVAGLMPAPLDVDGNGKLDPAENVYANKKTMMTAIAEGAYPSPPARDLYLLIKGQPNPLTRAFILWILGPGQAFADVTGYVALPKARLQAGQAKIK